MTFWTFFSWKSNTPASIAESLSVMVMPSQWQNLIAFAVMIVMLMVRPRGLFGRSVSR